jgi:hypothetical protein
MHLRQRLPGSASCHDSRLRASRNRSDEPGRSTIAGSGPGRNTHLRNRNAAQPIGRLPYRPVSCVQTSVRRRMSASGPPFVRARGVDLFVSLLCESGCARALSLSGRIGIRVGLRPLHCGLRSGHAAVPPYQEAGKTEAEGAISWAAPRSWQRAAVARATVRRRGRMHEAAS